MNAGARTSMLWGETTEVPSSIELSCSSCGHTAWSCVRPCERCGGVVDPVYQEIHGSLDLWVDGRREDDALTQYRSMLPVSDLSLYRLRLPRTPLVELDRVDGRRVFAKVEGVLPTGSTKDRLVAVSLPLMLERGIRRFCFSSTGNTAIAYAHGLHLYPELSGRAYMSTHVDREAIGPAPPNLDLVVVNGDYAQASRWARQHAHHTSFVHEGGFFNVGRREGAKIAYLEAFDQLAARGAKVGAVVQAVASGLGIYAASRAVRQLRSLGRLRASPQLFCAQQRSCAPMVIAYERELRGQPRQKALCNPRGIAPALLLGDPFASYDHVAHEVRDSEGGFVQVVDEDVSAVLKSSAGTGLPIGASAAVALAAVPQVVKSARLAFDESLLVMLTGGPAR